MKRLIVSALCVSIFFVGLGAVADQVGASFKSDEKALDIIAKARQAIGGDAAVANVRSLVIKGQTTHLMTIDGRQLTKQGETEIAMQLPGQFSKMIKIGNADGPSLGERQMIESKNVVIMRKGEGEPFELKGADGTFTTADGKTITITKADRQMKELEGADGSKVIVRSGDKSGDAIESADGKKVIVRVIGDGNGEWTPKEGEAIKLEDKKIAFSHTMGGHGEMRQNELLRTTLSLLVSAPDGMDVTYTFVGESDVDGTPVNVVSATAFGATFKLYFDRSSFMPVGMSYEGHQMPVVLKMRKEGGETVGADKDVVVFTKKMEGTAESAEQFVRFSDFRSTDGVQLPYKWTTTVGGALRETFDVASYEVNPANIADRFKEQKVLIRTAKPAEQN